MPKDPTFRAMLESTDKGNSSTGARFEQRMLKYLKDFAKEENVYRRNAGKELIHVLPYSKTEDERHGTDIMFHDKSGFFGINGYIRMDITHNFNSKDNMPFVANVSKNEKLMIKGLYGHEWEFNYGIRIGNPHENFKAPVIVIGFDMKPEEYKCFDKDMQAQENLMSNIYEIVNMSNDILQSFCYQTDKKFRKMMDAVLDEDERPDPELITFNDKYLMEAGKYVPKRWKLPEDTKLAKASRELLKDIVYSPVIEKLDQKYAEQGLSAGVAHIDGKGREAPGTKI